MWYASVFLRFASDISLLQCFDTVGWVTGRACSLWKTASFILKDSFQELSLE